MNTNEIKKLYTALRSKGYSSYDLGDENTFATKMEDKSSRKELYDWVSSRGDFRMGGYDKYEERLTSPMPPEGTTTDPIRGISMAPIEQTEPTESVVQSQQEEDEYQPLSFGQKMLLKGMSRSAKNLGVRNNPAQAVIDADKEMRELEENRQQFMDETQLQEVRQANRQQVRDMIADIDSAMVSVAPKSDFEGMPLAGPMGATMTAMRSTRGNADYNNYTTAKRSLSDASKIIEEADRHAADGTYGSWLETSFAGNAARGFGDKLFDIRTWDMGISDTMDNANLLQALNDFDEGKTLSKSQQALLDAKAVELATQAYFGSYLGRGYKAGQVTAEAIPFMIEMAINPASAMGKSAGNMMARYALKRFGKGAATKALSRGARVAGDIAGASTMAATTGIGRVASDATERMAGQVQFDTDENNRSVFAGHTEGEDPATAVAKAFGATTIENFSEMFGNYFSPILGGAGKVLRKGANKIGAGKVMQMLDDVAASDLARMVSDFERNAQWSGTIGEYAEEVAGGIMNAIFVGDQTLDADEQTGVFNLDNNIDTFLGVALLGGAMSTVKTVGYPIQKYQAKKRVDKADREGSGAFGDSEAWNAVKERVSAADQSQRLRALVDIMADESMTEEQKVAAFKYVEALQNRDGVRMGEAKHTQDPTVPREQVEVEQSYDNGYSLETSKELNDAKNMLEVQTEKIRRIYSLDDDADVDEFLGDDPIGNIIRGNEDKKTQQDKLDYINAKATYDGMLQRMRDDIDGQVEANNQRIDQLVNRDTKMVVPAKMKQDDRPVYIVGGNVVLHDDGSVNNSESTQDIIIYDEAKGGFEFTSPSAILEVGQSSSAEKLKATQASQIAEQYATAKGDQIDGVLPFVLGDTYPIMDDQGTQHVVKIVADNGDGTVSFTMDQEAEPTVAQKEYVQQMSDAYHKARAIAYNEQKKAQEVAEQETQAEQKATESQSTVVEQAQKPVIPTLKDGSPDYNAMDADMFTEQYVSQFGETITETVARNNIKEADKKISSIKKQIEGITDPNKLPALYTQLQEAERAKAKYMAVIENLGLSEDASEDNASRIQRMKQEATPRIAQLFPDGLPNVESVVLADIATGNKIRWSDKVVNGSVVSKGLGAELGLAESNAERTRRIALIGKDAPTPEEYAEQLRERLDAMGISYDESELRDKVIDVYSETDTRNKAWDQLEEISANMHAEPDVLDYEEEQKRRAFEREQNAMRPEAQSDYVEQPTLEIPTPEEYKQILQEFNDEAEYSLSDEVDENGRQFVISPNGELAFGEIDEESGLTPAPILLSEGMITNKATNDGYGLVHIEARHGDQIRKAGYKSVIEFIEEVAKNYEVIKEGNVRDGNNTYLLQITDKHNNTLMIELSGDGTYWNINTAGIFKTSYGKNRKEVYNRHTTAKQPAETIEESRNVEPSGTQTLPSMIPSSTLESSDSKDTTSEPKSQEVEAEISQGNAENVAEEQQTTSEAVAQAEAETDLEPTEAQKEANLGLQSLAEDKSTSEVPQEAALSPEERAAQHPNPEQVLFEMMLIKAYQSGNNERIEDTERFVRALLNRSTNVDALKEVIKRYGTPTKTSDVEQAEIFKRTADFIKNVAEEKIATLQPSKEDKKGKSSSAMRSAKPKKADDAKIEDFGEKIGGARKDVARARLRDSAKLSLKDLETIKDPDKILSRKAILKYLNEGAMTEQDAITLLALNMAARGKSGKRWTLDKYRSAALLWEAGEDIVVEITEQEVDEYVARLGERAKLRPNVREKSKQDLEYIMLTPYNDYKATYEALNYPMVYRDLRGTYVSKGFFDGRYWVKSNVDARKGFVFNTMEQAIARIRRDFPPIEVEQDKEAAKTANKDEKIGHINITKDDYGWYRLKSRSIPGNIYLSGRFRTKKEAEAYLEENKDMLLEREQKMTESLMGSNIGMVDRQGIDYRQGRDITPEEFRETFGFRGVEFGNWVPQAERQLYLNKTCDAIMDFCKVVGISPKAFSLGGELALAFGSRGKSRALAHYEPLKMVINLTRMKGAGSLAHEWFHALDNYLAKNKSGNITDMATARRIAVRPEVANVFREFVDKMNSMYYTKRSNNAGEYWGEVWERAARLLESYIYNELESQSTVSPLLVRKDALFDESGQSVEDFAKSVWPYPSERENAEIKPYFDKLFSTLEEKVDEQGNVILFRDGEDAAPTFYSNAEAAVRSIKQEKATPEQWLKMIEKNGGLKAGEDKWLGLSDWLKASDKKTLTKQEVLGYIAQNEIRVEEVGYDERGGVYHGFTAEQIYERPEFANLVSRLVEYNEDEDYEYVIIEEFNKLKNDRNFAEGFDTDYFKEGIVVRDPEAAAKYLGIVEDLRPIHRLREEYTTKGLNGKSEIALTVPTIAPWNKSDVVHFGDAGDGRAIAWIRFGETTDPDGKRVLVIDEIQSKRHQEGREHGYINSRLWEIDKRLEELDRHKSRGGLNTDEKVEQFKLQREKAQVIHRLNPELRDLYKRLEAAGEIYSKYLQSNADIQSEEYMQARNTFLELNGLYSREYKAAEAEAMGGDVVKARDDADDAYRKLAAFEAEMSAKYGTPHDWPVQATNEENDQYEYLRAEYDRLGEIYEDILDKIRQLVPDAPFEKNWAELAMKRMLRYAAENGFDKVAWTKGDQQAERYDLSKSVERIDAEDNNVEEASDGTPIAKNITIRTSNRPIHLYVDANGVIRGGQYANHQLSEVVGKGIAEKLMQKGDVSLSGDGLRIGGEGMKGFYDQMLPSFMNKYGKKWGVKVQDVTLPNVEEAGRTMHSVDVTESMRESVMQGQPMFRAVDTSFAHAEEVVSATQKIADKFGLTNEIVVAETQEVFVNELQSENVADELINPDAIAVFTPSGRIMVNATMISEMAELPDSIMHEFAHNVTHNGDIPYRIQDTVLEVGEARFEAFGRELFGTNQDPWVVADEIIATFVGNAANPALYEGVDLISGVVSGQYTTDEAVGVLMGSLTNDIRDGYIDVVEAMMPYVKEVFDAIKTNHDEQGTRAGSSKEKRRVRISVQGYAGEQKKGNNRSYDESYIRHKEYQVHQDEEDSRGRRKAVKEAAELFAKQLNTPIRIVEDVNTITDNNAKLQERKRNAKGWFDRNTNEVVVVLPNATSVEDVRETIFHEVVGHKGLQELVGKERFNAFLDKVFANASEEVRERIARRAAKIGWDFREATEEYIAEQAEQGFEDRENRNFFEVVRDLFLDMLSKAKIALGYNISDNDMRYMLWRTYQMQRSKGAMGIAEDMVMQQKLGVGNFAPSNTRLRVAAEQGGLSKRVSDIMEEYDDSEEIFTIEDVADRIEELLNEYDGNESTTALENILNDYRDAQSEANRYGHRWDAGGEEEFEEALRLYGAQPPQFRADDDVRFRAVSPSKISTNGIMQGIRNKYDKLVKTSAYQSREASQDLMLSLRRFMEMTAKAYGIPMEQIKDWENAYQSENALSSKNEAQIEEFDRLYGAPLIQTVQELRKKGYTYEQIDDYLQIKHGIERNREMAVRAAISDEEGKMDKEKLEKWNAAKERVSNNQSLDSWEKMQRALDKSAGDIIYSAYLDKIFREAGKKEREAIKSLANKKYKGDINRATEEFFDTFRSEGFRNFAASVYRDYSGLTAMYPDKKKIEDAVEKGYAEVNDFEGNVGQSLINELWRRIRAANMQTLNKTYRTSLISKDTFDSISSMYSYYVPLRGFAETTSDEVYGYLNNEPMAFNAPIRKARGRSSKADQVLPNVLSAAHSAILQGNRNMMKNQFLNFVQHYPTDLISVQNMWVEYDKTTKQWVAKFPDLEDTDTPEEVAAKTQAFEEKMKGLKEKYPNEYKQVTQKIDVPYIVQKQHLKQHQIVVKRNGVDVVLTVNGSPRLAIVMNGVENDSKMLGNVGNWASASTRYLSGIYTSYNPDFVVSNYIRDSIYTNLTVWLKESPAYAARFNKNKVITCNPINMGRLILKYSTGTLDMSNEVEKAFYDFVMNGGETGYAKLASIEQLKKDIGHMIEPTMWDNVKALGKKLTFLNRTAESSARFAAFLTSRQTGRSVARSVADAKEISVNFNKKGAGDLFMGAKDQTWVGKMVAGSIGFAIPMYAFFNAGMQGLNNFLRIYKHAPLKTTALTTGLFLLGALVASMLEGDDEEEYYALPESVRRQNIVFRAGDNAWVKIPLPIEMRAIYGLGEMFTSIAKGKEDLSDHGIAYKMAEQLSQVLPIDILEGKGGLGTLVPTLAAPILETMSNEDWAGLPIYRDDIYKGDSDIPEYLRVYQRTGKGYVAVSKALNDITGGDNRERGALGFVNPAVIEHLVDGYLGGPAQFMNKVVSSAEMAFGDKEFDLRGVPFANRLLMSNNTTMSRKTVNNYYYRHKEEAERIDRLVKNYLIDSTDPKQTDEERAKAAAKAQNIRNSVEWRKAQEFLRRTSAVEDIEKQFKNAPKGTSDEVIYVMKARANEVYKRGE